MTNPMFNPQPNYSGVTIQITNPAVNVGQYDGKSIPCLNSGYCNINQNGLPNNQEYINYPQAAYYSYAQAGINSQNGVVSNNPESVPSAQNMINPVQNTGYPNAYPAQYYLNNYNYVSNPDNNADTNNTSNINSKTHQNSLNSRNNDISDKSSLNSNSQNDIVTNEYVQNSQEQALSSSTQDNTNSMTSYKMYAQDDSKNNNDMTKSQNIIGDLEEREEKIQEEKKNSKETKIVALTDEYIKSLENYLNNPNDEIRLMASKDILTRLDEDKDRYDDAALNALLNKMLQDPNKLVRIAALSAFGSQLASGNDYTVKLLQNIQANPNSDKEDVLQAADILLKMSAGVEVKNIPNPSVKDSK